MLKTLLGLENGQQITGLEFSLGSGWIQTLSLVVAGCALVVYLYRSETRIPADRRWFLGICKGISLLILLLMVLSPVASLQLTQPTRRTVIVMLDKSKSMTIQDQWTSPEEVSEAARIMGEISLGENLEENKVDSMRTKLEKVTRFDLAQAALNHRELQMIEKLKEKYNVRLFSFADKPKAEDVDFKAVKPDGDSSLVGSSLDEAVTRYAGQNVAGVVVLSDFVWGDEKKNPITVAQQLSKHQGIPVYPVAIGSGARDVQIEYLSAPKAVLLGNSVRVGVWLKSKGFAGKRAGLEVSLDGEKVTNEEIELKDGLQRTVIELKPTKKADAAVIKVTVQAPGDTRKENNSRSHVIKVLDEKIKVLYIEGMPRWEYRYLRRVLLLPDLKLDVRFLMTEGDPKLAQASPRHLASFPQVAKDAFHFDLIILGDVPARYFNKTQLELIKDLVKNRHGSLLMIAGPVGAPGTYHNTPIADILPVKLGTGKWEPLTTAPVLTKAGRESDITQLSLSPKLNDQIWAKVRPTYLPPLEGVPSGATVLLTKPEKPGQSEYPLIAWQRFGTGKSMFVATEDLWRMRREVGNRYHAEFWKQAIHFLAFSRLLGKNKQIRLNTDRASYSTGQEIQIFADVVDQSFKPVDPVRQPTYPVVISRQGSVVAEVELSPVAGSPGLYSERWAAGEDGTYQMKSKFADARISNQVTFRVDAIPTEYRQTEAKLKDAQQIADKSGGKLLKLSELGTLPAVLGNERPPDKVSRLQMELWDTPVLYVLLVLFAGIEWFVRRKNNLV